MTEKDLDSMATVQMKQDYAPSEVYSTTSEPPPAYQRRSNSVQIAKICAFTVITSSIVIGSFVFASAYLQSHASCDQMQALDSILEKELILETMQQELPPAEALIGNKNEEPDLRNLAKDNPTRNEKQSDDVIQSHDNESDSDSSPYDNDDSDDLQQSNHQFPLEADLGDVAAVLLEINQKSRMNCAIERKHVIELVNSPAHSMQLPFGANLTKDPKKQKITSERISISCDRGSDEDKRESSEDAENIGPIFLPIQRLPISLEFSRKNVPLTHMPQSMISQPTHQMPPPLHHVEFPPHFPAQFMQAPLRGPEVRMKVQRVPLHSLAMPQEIQDEILSEQGSFSQQTQQLLPQISQIQVHRVPLGLALQGAGITADDLNNIQRMIEERITGEFRQLTEESVFHDDNSNSSKQVNQSTGRQEGTQLTSKSRMSVHTPMQEPEILHMGRSTYGRSVPPLVKIPIPMMLPEEMVQGSLEQENGEAERPHYVQPRNIRNVDDLSIHLEQHP